MLTSLGKVFNDKLQFECSNICKWTSYNKCITVFENGLFSGWDVNEKGELELYAEINESNTYLFG
jgi:hypothetical protein